jgi:hypothetical protein
MFRFKSLMRPAGTAWSGPEASRRVIVRSLEKQTNREGGIIRGRQRTIASRLDPRQVLCADGTIDRQATKSAAMLAEIGEPPVVLPLLVSEQHALHALEILALRGLRSRIPDEL